jgi:hypothetical protein
MHQMHPNRWSGDLGIYDSHPVVFRSMSRLDLLQGCYSVWDLRCTLDGKTVTGLSMIRLLPSATSLKLSYMRIRWLGYRIVSTYRSAITPVPASQSCSTDLEVPKGNWYISQRSGTPMRSHFKMWLRSAGSYVRRILLNCPPFLTIRCCLICLPSSQLWR